MEAPPEVAQVKETKPRTFHRAAPVLAGIGAWALLAANTAALTRDMRLEDLTVYRRLWADLGLAIQYHLDAVHPATSDQKRRRAEAAEPVATYRRIILERIQIRGLKPHQFWRTIRAEAFLRERERLARGDLDDPGRALLLAAGFRLLRGIAPFLIVWLGALLALPLVLWTVWEAWAARCRVAGASFVLLLAFSPFVVEALALTRSAVGFHLLGLMLLVPLVLYGVLGHPSPRGLVIRWSVAAVAFALFALCRGGVILLLPGYVLALPFSLARLQPRPSWLAATSPSWASLRLVAAGLLGSVLFVSPFLLMRPQEHHDTWLAIWEGLGDFDRTKGHTWSDPVAEAVARRGGAPALRSPETERILGEEVRKHVREDPAWYAAILARRFFATVTQQRLWPWTPRDGLFMAVSTSPNEGFMNKYYGYVTTADFIGFGPRAQCEVPVPLLIAPTAALGVLMFLRRRRSPEGWARLAALGVLAAASLGLPVLITTAGGVETQAPVLVYLLGAGFLLEQAWDRWASRAKAAAPSGAIACRP